MKNIIIVGSGGFAKEIYGYITKEISTGLLNNYKIKGFLDLSLESFQKMGIDSEYLGNEIDYEIEDNDEFIVAIGTIDLKIKIVNILLQRKANIMNYIHSTAIIDANATIGVGVIICPFCMVNNQAVIKDHCMLNIYSSVAHDCVLGEFSVLSPYATINGGVVIENKLFMSTRSSVVPEIRIGSNCIIAAGTVVTKNMKNNIMAFPTARTTYLNRK